MPGVNTSLKSSRLASSLFFRRQVMNDLVGTFPEFFGGEAGTGMACCSRSRTDFGDLQATDLNVFSHCFRLHLLQLISAFSFFSLHLTNSLWPFKPQTRRPVHAIAGAMLDQSTA